MEFSSNEYDYDIEDLPSEHINNVRSHNHQDKPMLVCIGEYYFPLDIGDSYDAIFLWRFNNFN